MGFLLKGFGLIHGKFRGDFNKNYMAAFMPICQGAAVGVDLHGSFQKGPQVFQLAQRRSGSRKKELCFFAQRCLGLRVNARKLEHNMI